MACYYPMDAIKINGKVKVLGSSIGGNFTRLVNGSIYKTFQVPCGKCIGCRLEYSRQWAIRCMNEMKTTLGQCWFLTITYDNEHLPRQTLEEDGTGIRVQMPTLRPKDLQDFVKRLREALRKKGVETFRYYACGEYGDELKRPHYHMIAFNLPLDDLVYYKSIRGHEYYNSEFLDKIWHDQGFIVVSDVNFECCAYVARYVMKKAKGDNYFEYADTNNLVREFVRMSRRPGIGAQYYLDHKTDMYGTDEKIGSDSMGWYPTQNGPINLKPVKYYDKLYDVDIENVDSVDHQAYVKLKSNLRKQKYKRIVQAERKLRTTLSNTALSPQAYNEVLERQKQDVTKQLKRDLC